MGHLGLVLRPISSREFHRYPELRPGDEGGARVREKPAPVERSFQVYSILVTWSTVLNLNLNPNENNVLGECGREGCEEGGFSPSAGSWQDEMTTRSRRLPNLARKLIEGDLDDKQWRADDRLANHKHAKQVGAGIYDGSPHRHATKIINERDA